MKEKENVSFFSAMAFVLGIFSAVFLVFKLLNKGQKRNSFEKSKYSPVAKPVGNRDDGILDVFKRDGELTVEVLLKEIGGVSERTLRRDLKKLEDRGLIKKIGSTKGSKYLYVK